MNEWKTNPVLLYGVMHDQEKKGIDSFEVRFRLERLHRFYISQVVIPLSIIVSIAWVALSLDITSVSDRLSIILTLLLTAVAFKYIVAGYLPHVPYFTAMDKYVLFCFLVLFFSAIEIPIIYTCSLYYPDQATLIGYIDIAFWCTLYGFHFCAHIIWLVFCGATDRCCRPSWEYVELAEKDLEQKVEEEANAEGGEKDEVIKAFI